MQLFSNPVTYMDVYMYICMSVCMLYMQSGGKKYPPNILPSMHTTARHTFYHQMIAVHII